MKLIFKIGEGIDKYLSQLENLERASEETCGRAIYAGADIVADAIKENIAKIPVDEGFAGSGSKLHGIKKIQKIGLEKSFGITKLRWDGDFLNVKAGFDGYNLLKSKKYPNGQPNQMIARTLEGGNSFTQKHPFVAPAVRETTEPAERRMAEVVDLEVGKIMT